MQMPESDAKRTLRKQRPFGVFAAQEERLGLAGMRGTEQQK